MINKKTRLDVRLNERISVPISVLGVLIVFALLSLHLSGIYFSVSLGKDHFISRQLIKLFYFDGEYNITSWFSSSLLWTCGLLLLAMSFAEKTISLRKWLPWFLLGIIFITMSMDEAVALHEWMIKPMRKIVPESGFFHFAWVVPGLIFVALIGIIFTPFLLRLPRATLLVFLIAGCLYITGAIGFEMIGGYILSHSEVMPHRYYTVSMTLEELLEMAGIIIFLHGISTYGLALYRRQK